MSDAARQTPVALDNQTSEEALTVLAQAIALNGSAQIRVWWSQRFSALDLIELTMNRKICGRCEICPGRQDGIPFLDILLRPPGDLSSSSSKEAEDKAACFKMGYKPDWGYILSVLHELYAPDGSRRVILQTCSGSWTRKLVHTALVCFETGLVQLPRISICDNPSRDVSAIFHPIAAVTDKDGSPTVPLRTEEIDHPLVRVGRKQPGAYIKALEIGFGQSDLVSLTARGGDGINFLPGLIWEAANQGLCLLPSKARMHQVQMANRDRPGTHLIPVLDVDLCRAVAPKDRPQGGPISRKPNAVVDGEALFGSQQSAAIVVNDEDQSLTLIAIAKSLLQCGRCILLSASMPATAVELARKLANAGVVQMPHEVDLEWLPSRVRFIIELRFVLRLK